MSNSLTGLDNAYWSKQQLSINNIQSNIKGNSNTPNKPFAKMLSDVMSKEGKIIETKLNKDEKKLYDTCVELESMLWKQVLNSMKKTVYKYRLLDGGNAENIFRDFLYDEYSMLLAKNSSTKISDNIFKQLSNNYK